AWSLLSCVSVLLSAHHPHLPSFPTRRSSDLLPTASSRRRGRGVLDRGQPGCGWRPSVPAALRPAAPPPSPAPTGAGRDAAAAARSEEHTSELQSRENLVCRLLLEKKNT